jgi:predicted enzyme involved in methoxymalonyl-ACP biosynthesis
MRSLRGWYLPTRKNAPSKDFYPKHGFKMINENDGKLLFEYDLGKELGWPDWIELRTGRSESR